MGLLTLLLSCSSGLRGMPGAPFMRSMSGNFLFTTLQLPFSDFQAFFVFPSHQPAATFSSRSSVSGYRPTSRTSAAARGFGLALACSHFYSVLSLIRNFRANSAREHRIPISEIQPSNL